MVAVVYSRGLNAKSLFRNVDNLIDEHNEKIEREFLFNYDNLEAFQMIVSILGKMARDIKNLKLDLMSSVPRVKKNKEVQPSSEEAELRLVTEAVDEVASLDPVVNDAEELPDIMQELIRRGLANVNTFEPIIEQNAQSIIPEDVNPEVVATAGKSAPAKVGTFASRLEQSSSTQHSQSLLREQPAVEDYPGPKDIYMPEAPQSSLNLHDFGEDLGEVDGDQLAALGLLARDYSLGKRLYDRVKIPESLISNEVAPPAPVRISEIEAPSRMSSIEQNAPNIAEDMDIDKPATAPFIPSQINEDDAAVPTDQPLTRIAVPPKEKSVNEIEKRLQDLLTTPSQSTQPQAIVQDAISSPVRPSGTSRSDYYRKIIEEIGQQVLTKRKPRRKQRRQQDVDNDVAEMNKHLVKRKHKSKKARLHLPECKLKIITDIYDGLEDYEDDLPQAWYEDEPMVENLIVHQPTPTVDVTPIRLNESPMVKAPVLPREETSTGQQAEFIRSSNSEMVVPPITEVAHLPKRPRFSLNDQPMELDSFSLNLINKTQTPMQDFKPQHVSTATSKFVPHDQRLTCDEIEHARLQYISERNLSEIIIAQTGGSFQGGVETPSTANVPEVDDNEPAPRPIIIEASRPEKIITTTRPEYAKNGERHLRRYVFEGEKMVEFFGVKNTGSLSSRLERHSEYVLEVSKIRKQFYII